MRRIGAWALGVALASGFLAPSGRAASAASGEGAAPRPLVIWLSLDGVRHDYPERGAYPAFERMAREGLRARRLRPTFPTSTFPNHVSMATCAHPDLHGIVGNRFVDEEEGRFDYSSRADWIRAEPIWVSAERQGVRAAAFFWVGSESDWRGRGAGLRMRPFDSDVSESTKVDQILEWVDLPRERRPGLILSWWHGTDRVGHRMGPEHPDVFERLAAQDRQLQRLLAGLDARGLWDRTTLVVVSDHGMTAVSEGVDPRAALRAEGIDAIVTAGAAVAHVYLAEGESISRAEAVFAGRSEVRAHRASALPQALRMHAPGRVGDLVLEVEPPYYFLRAGFMASLEDWLAPLLGLSKGAHGYRPELPDMGGIFFALGRGIPPGVRLGEVRNLDIAPSIAKLLGIEPPASCEGRPLPEVSPLGDE